VTLPRYAYLGPAGTFTEAALRVMAPAGTAEHMPMVDVPSALGAVRSGEADYAVVAIENSVEGGVTATLDTLAEGEPLVILGEVVLAISFELVARPGTRLEDVTRISAHSHGLNQCRRWIADNLPGALQVPASSNAAAAVALADGSAEFDAALAPPGTADSLGLDVLVSGVSDRAASVTRFVRIGRPGDLPQPTGADKTTLVVHLPSDKAGALLQMLEQFSARGVNLSRIESRPRGDKPGEYSFSMDAMGHIAEARVAEALIGLRRTCPVVRFLGSYPAFHGEATPVAPETTDASFDEARDWVEALRDGRA